MPILPPALAAPYPTADQVLNRARAIINDAAQTIAGNLLSNAQPFTFEDLNAAYEDIQDELANHGYETLVADTVITSIRICTPTLQADPGTQLWMSYTSFFDGGSTFTTPVLPSDMVIPLRLWERQNGTTQPFIPMNPVNDGLPSVSKGSYLRVWDWLNDKIYFVGANQVQDIRIRYIKYLPVLASANDPVLIFRSKNAIAYKVAEVFARSRGSLLADSFKASSQEYVAKICKRTARKKQRGNHRRKPYGWAGHNSAVQF